MQTISPTARSHPGKASANTKQAFGKATVRMSGVRWKRSDASTIGSSALGTRKVQTLSGVASNARLRAWSRQNSSSSTRSSSCSTSAALVGVRCRELADRLVREVL